MKKYAIHNHTDVIEYNYTYYTETLAEAKKLFNQMKQDIINALNVVEVIEDHELEYYVECKNSYERVYIEVIK
jgi:hypothetical protein